MSYEALAKYDWQATADTAIYLIQGQKIEVKSGSATRPKADRREDVSRAFARESNPTACWCPCIKGIGHAIPLCPAGMRQERLK